MTDLNQIITVQIDRNTTTPTQQGFGTAALVGFFPTSIFPERVRTYTSLEALITDGFTASDPVYKMAAALKAQNPSPPQWKVGRRASPPQQILEVTPDAPVVGEVHRLEITGYGDSAFSARTEVTDVAEVTVTTEVDAEDIIDGWLTDLATPGGDYTPAKVGLTTAATMTITADNTDVTMDGLLFNTVYTVNGLPRGIDDVTIEDDVAGDIGAALQADLAAIYAEDPDWYALAIDSNSQVEIAGATGSGGAASWVNSNKKIAVFQTQDIIVASQNVTTDTTSVAADLRDANNDRAMLFCHRGNLDYVSCAMLGRALPEDSGSITWAYKQLSGVLTQRFTAGELSNMSPSVSDPTGGKNVNTLTTLAGVNVTRYGQTSGGEFMDIARGADWLEARITERVYTLLVNNDKLPYTDAGIQAVVGEVLAQLQAGIARDFIAPDPEPTVTAPLARDVSAADKGGRILRDVKFRATLAGAIHYVVIEGELNLT